MTLKEIEKLIIERLGLIEAKQEELRQLALAVEAALYDAIVNRYDDIAKKYSLFYSVYADFVQEHWRPFVAEVVKVLDNIIVWNEDYFLAQQGNLLADIRTKAKTRILEVYGLTEKGAVIKGGYIDGLNNATIIKDRVGQFLASNVAQNQEKPASLKELSKVIRGRKDPEIIGAARTFSNQYIYDRLQEADRIAQTVFADELGMQAMYYIGALRETSRPFCKARAGKVFLTEEVNKFGTPEDKYGGYENKKTGYFKGKPKAGYVPAVMLGGIRCVHTTGYITNETALSARKDLQVIDGRLRIKD